MFKKNLFALFMVFLFAFAFLVSGCSDISRTRGGEVLDDAKLSSFSSEEEFQKFLDSTSGVSHVYYQGAVRAGVDDFAMDMAEPLMESSFQDSSGDSLDYSDTNIQVEGVDELDIIKTDGDFIYTSSGKDLFIIDAYPPRDAEILSTINSGNTITGLFVEGDVLAVVGLVDNFDDIEDVGFSHRSGLTFIDFYDVSDRHNPELLKEYKFDGRYFNARLFDGVIYLSTNYNPFSRPVPIPIVMVDGVSRTMSPSDIYVYDTNYESPAFVGIHSLKMDTQENVDSKIITLEGSNHMYMSHNNIYLTHTDRINRYEIEQDVMLDKIIPNLPSKDRDFINRVNDVDDDILSANEKRSKIMGVVTNYVSHLPQAEQDELEEEVKLIVKEKLEELGTLEFTIINKVSVSDGALVFEGVGKVPGHIYGQFALDEHDGILRVATTIRDGMMVSDEYDAFDWRSRSPSVNNVYTLDDDMNIIGELEGLAPTESIYSTRYVDDRLYMVTRKNRKALSL